MLTHSLCTGIIVSDRGPVSVPGIGVEASTFSIVLVLVTLRIGHLGTVTGSAQTYKEIIT